MTLLYVTKLTTWANRPKSIRTEWMHHTSVAKIVRINMSVFTVILYSAHTLCNVAKAVSILHFHCNSLTNRFCHILYIFDHFVWFTLYGAVVAVAVDCLLFFARCCFVNLLQKHTHIAIFFFSWTETCNSSYK